MEKYSKKEIKEQYRNRVVIGGIYCITCNGSSRKWIKSTKDLAGQSNKFEFFTSTNLCPEPGMISDWNQYGAQSFSFDILEKLEKGETQTEKEFEDDIRTMYDMLLEQEKEKYTR
ncbi:MAG: hypothetical protein H6Q59_1372 [Firmicutes bacterium]|nr:hypothetical protein [Bacillota bacterium]